jgi:hypothetical protein
MKQVTGMVECHDHHGQSAGNIYTGNSFHVYIVLAQMILSCPEVKELPVLKILDFGIMGKFKAVEKRIWPVILPGKPWKCLQLISC